MPPAAREAVVSRLRADKHVPLDDIRDIIAEAKQQDKVARADAKKTAEQKAKEARSKASREARQAAAAIDWRVEAEAREAARAKAAALIARGLSAKDLAELQSLMHGPEVYIYCSDIVQAVRDIAAAGTPPTASSRQEAAAAEMAFEGEFWPAYPRKDDKGRARKAFLSVIKAKTATVSDLVNGALRYAAERQGDDPKYTKQPATWLNAEAWLNAAPPAPPAGSRMPAGQVQSRSQSAMAGIMSYGMTQEAPYVDGPVIEG
jgi:DNA-binding transcriptional MerR regulator